MIWRSVYDCYRNCVSSYADYYVGKKRTFGLNSDEKIRKMKKLGFNWSLVSECSKHGVYMKKKLYETEVEYIHSKTKKKMTTMATRSKMYRFTTIIKNCDNGIIDLLLAKHFPSDKPENLEYEKYHEDSEAEDSSGGEEDEDYDEDEELFMKQQQQMLQNNQEENLGIDMHETTSSSEIDEDEESSEYNSEDSDDFFNFTRDTPNDTSGNNGNPISQPFYNNDNNGVNNNGGTTTTNLNGANLGNFMDVNKILKDVNESIRLANMQQQGQNPNNNNFHQTGPNTYTYTTSYSSNGMPMGNGGGNSNGNNPFANFPKFDPASIAQMTQNAMGKNNGGNNNGDNPSQCKTQ